jgi:hypothetical protein
MKRLPARALLAAGLMLLSVASYGQTSISSVPYTITGPGTYVLANNLLYSSASGAAIKISSPNVTLDFDGHFVAFTAASPENYGVAVNQVRNVTIENGKVTGFYYGIYFSNGSGDLANNAGHIVENMRITHCSVAVQLNFGSGCVIRNNYINGFGTRFPVGVYLGGGGGNQLIRNRVLNCYEGIAAFDGNSSLESNFVYNCAFGLDMDDSDKYRFNTTISCATPFSHGKPRTDDNN